jgi:PAS domain S-box-containing protein
VDTRLRHALRAVSAAATAFLETTSDRARLLDTVVRAVAEVVPDICMVSMRSADLQSITVEAIHDNDPAIRAVYEPMLRIPRALAKSRLAASAFTDTVFIPQLDIDAMVDRMAPDSIAALRRVGARGLLVVPLSSRGELLGLMTVIRRRAELPPLDELDRELVEHLANHAALALANAKLASERNQMASEVAASRFLDAVIENIPDMVFVKDAVNLAFVRFNRAGEDLLGARRDELIGKSDHDFFPPEEAAFFIEKDRETLAGKRLVDIPEEPIKTAFGQRWLHTKKVPILDDTGTPRFLLGISEDITERKQAMAALAQARDKAEAANRELEAFSYSVAHDLRAPLRAIDGFAQALLEDYGAKLDVVGTRHLDRIRAAAQRMALLIDDLLRLSRVTRAEQRLEAVNLSSLARIAVAQLERADPSRNVDVVIEDSIYVMADPKLLAIVLDNLFGNAWKFTGKVAHPRIELGTKRVKGEPVYFVRDNGAGFDMEYQNKLFGVFQRLHTMHEFPGTGVGLATVKRIIERHGGRVWAEGAVGKGATFFFTLGEKA